MIASSTLALRVALFPLLLLQLKKLQKFGQLYHKCEFLTFTIILQIKAQLLCLLLLLIWDCWWNLVFFFCLLVHPLKFGFACNGLCTLQLFFLFNLYAFLIVPPAFPPPLSGKSYINQFLLYRKERKAIGCPSFLWVAAYFSVQVLYTLWTSWVVLFFLERSFFYKSTVKEVDYLVWIYTDRKKVQTFSFDRNQKFSFKMKEKRYKYGMKIQPTSSLFHT